MSGDTPRTDEPQVTAMLMALDEYLSVPSSRPPELREGAKEAVRLLRAEVERLRAIVRGFRERDLSPEEMRTWRSGAWLGR